MNTNHPHFSFRELIKSPDADRMGFDNMPNEISVYERLELLMSGVLEPLRKRYGSPIFVNSGFRCEKLNEYEHGAENSYHLKGRAADITTRSWKGNKKLFEILCSMKEEGVPIVELLWEGGGSWIHVAY